MRLPSTSKGKAFAMSIEVRTQWSDVFEPVVITSAGTILHRPADSSRQKPGIPDDDYGIPTGQIPQVTGFNWQQSSMTRLLPQEHVSAGAVKLLVQKLGGCWFSIGCQQSAHLPFLMDCGSRQSSECPPSLVRQGVPFSYGVALKGDRKISSLMLDRPIPVKLRGV